MADVTLVLEGIEVPLPADTEVAVTYKAQDMRNAFSRAGAYAETIELPDTAIARSVLGSSQLLNSATNAPYRLLPASLKYKGNPFITGTATHPEAGEGFTVDVQGQNADLFARIKGLDLADLDLADLDHTYNQATVTGANSHNAARGYVYPLINYGLWFQRYFDPTNQHYTELFPAVYASELLKRIAAPYTLAGSLLSEGRFQKMVVPFVNDAFVYRESYLDQFKATGTVTAATDYTINTGVLLIGYDTITQAAHGLISGNKYIVSALGRYRVKADLNVSTGNSATVVIYARLNNNINEHLAKQEMTRGATVKLAFDFTTNVLQPGDALYLNLASVGLPNTTTILPGSTFTVELENRVTEGGPVHLDANLPDMAQEDFLLFILNEFNVLIQANPVTGVVRLDLLRDIDTKEPLDWSNKIDWKQKPRYTFALENYAQTNYFKYAELDYGSPGRQDQFALTVANERLELETDLYEAPFAATEIHPAFRGNLRLPFVPVWRQVVESLGLWRNSIQYSDFDYVYYQGNYWHAVTTNTNSAPALSNPDWFQVPESDVREWLGATPRVLVLETRTGQPSIPVGENAGGAFTPLTTQGFFYGGSGIDAATLKTAYHAISEKMLQQTRFATFFMRLTLADIMELDFLRAVAINVPERGTQGVFYVNAVNQFNPKLSSCEVELVRLFGRPFTLPANSSGHLEFSEEFSNEWA